MKIPENLLSNSWKIILVPALIAIAGSIANHFGYVFEPQTSGVGDNQTPKTELGEVVQQQIGDGNTNPTIINGDNNKVTNSSETNEVENIEKQINTERYIETEQYNENNGSGINNCVVNEGTCNENNTTNINSAQ